MKQEQIRKRMAALAVKMGVMKEGADYFYENDQPELAEKFLEQEAEKLAADVIAALQEEGQGREEAIIHGTGITQEERNARNRILFERGVRRLTAYVSSNYMRAFSVITDAATEFFGQPLSNLEEKQTAGGLFDALSDLARYYFVIQEKYNPAEHDSFSDADILTLNGLAKEYLNYHSNVTQTVKTDYTKTIWEFIDAPAAERQTDIISMDHFSLPIAKPYREQYQIALFGSEGTPLNIGTPRKPVLIEAKISTRDGKPIEIDGLTREVQRAVGNLIDENGGWLPVNITPQQIYRALYRLPPDANVTPQQVEEIKAAMSKAIDTPSDLDFKAQLAEHKKIKKQNDYDYTVEDSGHIRGHLIVGVETTIIKAGKLTEGYTIFMYPMMYQHAHIVGQMAQVKNVLLTGPEKPATKEQERQEAQNGTRTAVIKSYVIGRVKLMQHYKKANKPFSRVINLDELITENFILYDEDGNRRELTARERRTIIKNVELYLADLTEQKEIAGYTAKKGLHGKISGYQINL